MFNVFNWRYYQTYSKKEIKTSFLWIPEESHTVNRDISILKVEEGEYVTEKAEILPNIYSQISGIVQTIQKNNILQETIIKPGFTYKIKNCKRFEQKLYYPGEIIFDNLKIQELSLAEVIETTSGPELLIRPVSLFCIPKLPKVSRRLASGRECLRFRDSLSFEAPVRCKTYQELGGCYRSP